MKCLGNLTGCCLLAALTASVSSCTATVVYEHATAASTGIRYYESAPYLLIYSDGKGGLKWQILYLPDQSHTMSATPEVRGGAAQMTLYFQNGVLGTSTVQGDTTAIPSAILAAAQAAVPLLIGAGVFEGPKPVPFPSPYLFKIVVSGGSVRFIGGQGTDGDGKAVDIQVPLPPPPGG